MTHGYNGLPALMLLYSLTAFNVSAFCIWNCYSNQIWAWQVLRTSTTPFMERDVHPRMHACACLKAEAEETRDFLWTLFYGFPPDAVLSSTNVTVRDYNYYCNSFDRPWLTWLEKKKKKNNNNMIDVSVSLPPNFTRPKDPACAWGAPASNGVV